MVGRLSLIEKINNEVGHSLFVVGTDGDEPHCVGIIEFIHCRGYLHKAGIEGLDQFDLFHLWSEVIAKGETSGERHTQAEGDRNAPSRLEGHRSGSQPFPTLLQAQGGEHVGYGQGTDSPQRVGQLGIGQDGGHLHDQEPHDAEQVGRLSPPTQA